jgi:hypothetical protein
MDAGFRASREHDVCFAGGDEACGVADTVGASGAGCCCCVVGAFETVAEGDVCGAEVYKEAGDE